METTYKFEYGISTIYDLETPADTIDGTGSMPITPIDVGSLQPGKTYHYRLVAENELGTTYGEDRTFTVPAKPLIVGLHPRNVLATSADLHARINNYDSETEYFFEYGPSAAVSNTTQVEILGADPGFQEVSTQISNLTAGLTYYFRLAATNEHGTSFSPIATFDFSPPDCPNSHVRQQTGANYLPDCRAYELVSPARAGSIQLFPGDLLSRLPSGSEFSQPDTKHRYQNAGLATSPSRFGFFGAFGGIAGLEAPNVILDHYVASRTAGGWTTTYRIPD
jgi:hypothetical protein